MESTVENILFLPGAAGDGTFWSGVGKLLPDTWHKQYLNWPGLGNQPGSPFVNSLADLFDLAERQLTKPSAIVAQSMGGIIGIQLALKHPELVARLVLVATSGGLDVSRFGAADWRSEFKAAFPRSAPWIMTDKADLTGQFSQLKVPTLLIWGDQDPISPAAVGHHLASEIRGSKLTIVPKGQHSMAVDMPEVLAVLIESHLVEMHGT